MQLIEKIKKEKGGEKLTFKQEDGHVPKVKGFNRRNLGRKLTEEEHNQREKIRAARRRRKELRRLEQIRRKEWRLAHQNPETGDYDEYGAFPGLAELETVDKKQARKQRRQ